MITNQNHKYGQDELKEKNKFYYNSEILLNGYWLYTSKTCILKIVCANKYWTNDKREMDAEEAKINEKKMD